VLRCAVGAGLVLAAGTGAAQDAPRYQPAQLACARYTERIDSDIQGEAGGRPRADKAGRTAIWTIRGTRRDDSTTTIEAWFDSLAIWRTSGDARHAPDTDGIIGGRYRGTLSPTGSFLSTARPFVPPEVAEFADLRNAFADLLPPLPHRALRPGESWTPGPDLTIQRLGDSTSAHGPIRRYRLERHAAARDTTVAAGDSVTFPVRQGTTEEGEFAWDPARGLVSRSRRITIETEVPAGQGLRYPVRSRIVQRVRVVRLPDSAAGCP
jgi:hypothetical protein